MVKFLEGGSYTGERVPVCTFWSTTETTDKDTDFALLRGQNNSGNCIANAFVPRSDITCFNEGDCNGEGKCLPCFSYRYSGLRLGIGHSPPLDILRQFNGGLSEEEVKSPNLAAFPPNIINLHLRDQTPLHILIRNVQAKIAKCCRWNQGDGAPSEFYLTTIIDGPDEIPVEDEDDNQVGTVKGIQILHPEFPDDVGVFFPVGSVVVAGFRGSPSFYLEPRTGLVKPGEGVIFVPEGDNPVAAQIKRTATSATRIIIDTVNALAQVCNEVNNEAARLQQLLENAQATQNLLQVESLEEQLEAVGERAETACTNAEDAQEDAQDAIDLIDQIVNEEDVDTLESLATELADTIEGGIVVKGEAVVAAGSGGSSTTLASNLLGILQRVARDIDQAGARSFTKCQFFFEEGTNVAKVWNNPDDGTPPCNGVRTDCDYYTGRDWEHATEENLEIGKPITAEAIQELRWRSTDWARLPQPEQEFRRRFATPFIWAFKGYVDVSGEPDVEDMLLYRPQVLYARDTAEAEYQTIEVERVNISDFDNFSLAKAKYRIEPGSESLDLEGVPSYPTLINSLTVPTPNRLSITHPRKEDPDDRFIYRVWSPDRNKLTMFGTATPRAAVYLVNETALRERQRYHSFLGTRDFEDDMPEALPGAPDFVGIAPRDLLDIFQKLEREQHQTDSTAPLGFAKVTTDPAGFWRVTRAVDLVHQQINTIYAFTFVSDSVFLFDQVEVDFRVLHAYPIQTNFDGEDFTMGATGGSVLTVLTSDVAKKAEIRAEWRQALGDEELTFAYGYYGLRFRDRGLKRNQGLNADNDLTGDPLVADPEEAPAVAEPLSSSQITSVGYRVVQYRKKDVAINDWYVLDDCGTIMIKIPEPTANRVLPLPNVAGQIKPLPDVMVDGGVKGSVIAQFALESATLTVGGTTKDLAQVYRDPDGDGLPAHYIVLGPSVDVEQAFGRPDPESDRIIITYVYLQAQTTALGQGAFAAANPDDEVVNNQFYGDQLRPRSHSIVFGEEDGFLVVGDKSEVAQPAGAGEGEEEGGGGSSQSEIKSSAITDLTQDYVWVFKDEEGRPIGRKYTRLLVMYGGVSCVNVEIFYAWEGSCSTYALVPDQNLIIGGGNGSLSIKPRGTTNPNELNLGFRLAQGLVGAGQRCIYFPSCSDHEYLPLSGPRKEFEIIARSLPAGQVPPEGRTGLKAFFANQTPGGEVISVLLPESFFTIKKGPMWFPYTACERPRYNTNMSIGPAGTDSTELINKQLQAAGFAVGVNVLQDEQAKSAGGSFGDLPSPYEEAYRGPDLVTALILDIHPSLRACSSAYTYGNRVLDGRVSNFAGVARRRGQLDVSIYEDKQWTPPMFGNLGRNLLFFEVSDQRGDFLNADDNVEFRWMPIFPERGNLGAGAEFFGEELETQMQRQIQVSSPLGSIGETVSESPERFSHKALVRNSLAGGGDYPALGLFPVFVSDGGLGEEPEDRGTDGNASNISTMWAWREQERPIGRATSGSELLTGLKLRSPDYILDNRGLEVRLRPDEGPHTIAWRPPRYDINTGEMTAEGAIGLDSGPPRDLIIDFVNRNLSVGAEPDSVYDLEQEIGDAAFPCQEGQEVDSVNFLATCSCESDTSSGDVNNESNLPSRVLHLEQLAPEGYFVLYESTQTRTPFAAPLARSSAEDPCCQCVYYIRGIYAALDVEYLPSTPEINPVRDGRITTDYTWSRVPHGDRSGNGRDGGFSATETLADSYTDAGNGEVFLSGLTNDTPRLSNGEHLKAFFPSISYAAAANADGNPIIVTSVAPSELKPGAIEAVDGISRGQQEPIVLDLRFNTYVRLDRVTVRLFGGTGWEIPTVTLRAVDPASRGFSAPVPTLRTARELASSQANELAEIVLLGQGDLASLEDEEGDQLVVTLRPSYIDSAFWTRYAMEYQILFSGRVNGSLGIAAVELEGSAFLPDLDTFETIEVQERKYYTSVGSAAGAINPESTLAAADSATAYWRGTSKSATNGANKYRAYAWGEEVDDNQDFISGDSPGDLEELQAQEFRETLELMASPAIFEYRGFIPNEERAAIQFYGGDVPSWTNTMSNKISEIDQIFIGGDVEGTLRFGEIPKRTPWHAPGHSWTFTTEDAYQVCDSTKDESVMVVNFNFAHLHDGLDIVETADFWEELPSGLTRILRSATGSPDPTLSRGLSGLPPDEENSGQAALLDASQFEGISPAILEKAGFSRNPDGSLVLTVQGGE